MTDDDILARIPDLWSLAERLKVHEPHLAEIANALEAAQARIAALEIDLELGWSRSGLQERVALALRERDNAQARIAELEAERDQYKFLLTESHSSDYYRAEKAEQKVKDLEAELLHGAGHLDLMPEYVSRRPSRDCDSWRPGLVTPEQRFWDKVEVGAECWEWTGNRSTGGYGQFWMNGKLNPATHFAWLLATGCLVPEGLHVCHHCDNRGCVRFDHLFVGTRLDNMQDCVRKGRNIMQTHPERSSLRDGAIQRQRGSSHHHSRLGESDVEQIRERRNEKAVVLAEEFGITAGHVRRLWRGESWTHVV
jgi:hypothetical protein